MGWIGCAIQQVTPKGLPRFFSNFQDIFLKLFHEEPTNHNCPHIFDTYYFWYRWCDTVARNFFLINPYVLLLNEKLLLARKPLQQKFEHIQVLQVISKQLCKGFGTVVSCRQSFFSLLLADSAIPKAQKISPPYSVTGNGQLLCNPHLSTVLNTIQHNFDCRMF